jgi:hypothetical protein
MAEPTVQVYDPDTKTLTTIPVRELSDAMIAANIPGIDGTVYIDRQNLKVGEVRHKALPVELVARIRKVASALEEVLPDPLEKWVEDFRRDEDPETEVVIWERVAGKFLLLTDPSDAKPRKREVARVLLDCSTNSAVIAQLTASCRHLNRDEIVKICEEWER